MKKGELDAFKMEKGGITELVVAVKFISADARERFIETLNGIKKKVRGNLLKNYHDVKVTSVEPIKTCSGISYELTIEIVGRTEYLFAEILKLVSNDSFNGRG